MNRKSFLTRLGASPARGIVVVENQSVKDIMALMKYKHQKHTGDYDKLASDFWQGNIYDTCHFLYDWCKKNIHYCIEDEEQQTVSSPQRILSKGKGDCKHYALFIAGILDALTRQGHRIDWYYRYASYNPFDSAPGHVFVVVKNNGQEIWIDPVLSEFDYHKTFQFAFDRKIRTATMNGIGFLHNNSPRPHGRSNRGLSRMSPLESVGATATTAQTGQSLIKVSAALAPIPVVGWIAAAAGGIVGGALSIFGDTHQQSSDVLWLVQLYQQNVLGQTGITASNANDALTPQAQAWFSVVLGVPIGARSDFNILQSGDTNNNFNGISKLSDAQRGQLYLSWKGAAAQGKVTLAQATEAAHIAAYAMNPYAASPKSWAGFTAAPSTLDTSLTPSQTTAAQASLLPAFLTGSNAWIWIAGGVLLFLVLNPGKRKPRRA
jgi:hypothetical protein